MNNPYNKLTDAEAERIAMLLEECAEVTQLCGKILRHGYESYHPADSLRTTNRTLLRQELTDLQAALAIMQGQGDIEPDDAQRMAMCCGKKLAYCHHQ